METPIDYPNSETAPAAPARPQFLTVLCILTWIACGISLLQTLWQVVNPDTPEEQYEQVEKMREINPEQADRMEAAFEAMRDVNPAITTSINLVAIGLSAFGAYLMWQLRRRGYFLYLAGEIIPYASFLIIGWQTMSAMFGGSAIATGVVAGMVLLDVVFFVLYAVNLKHMRN